MQIQAGFWLHTIPRVKQTLNKLKAICKTLTVELNNPQHGKKLDAVNTQLVFFTNEIICLALWSKVN